MSLSKTRNLPTAKAAASDGSYQNAGGYQQPAQVKTGTIQRDRRWIYEYSGWSRGRRLTI